MRRSFALLLALWLSLLSADLPSLHACAMHGALGHAAAGHAAGNAAGNAAAGNAEAASAGHEHGTDATAASPIPNEVPADDGASGCQCLGDCCAASVALLHPAGVQEFAVVLRRALAPVRGGTRVDSRAPDLTLPFSIGPPGRTTV